MALRTQTSMVSASFRQGIRMVNSTAAVMGDSSSREGSRSRMDEDIRSPWPPWPVRAASWRRSYVLDHGFVNGV